MQTVSLLAVVAGVILWVVALFLFLRQRGRLARRLTAQGVVTELLPVRSTGDYLWRRTPTGVQVRPKYRYRPVVRFKPRKGPALTFTAGLSMRPAPFQVGEPVPVLYNPDNPREAQIAGFIHSWFAPLICACFGFFAVGMGLLGLLL